MMQSFKRFLAALNARNKEFVRDHAALGWNFAFPILVVAGFGFAFTGKSQEIYKVSIYQPSGQTQQAGDLAFLKTQYIQFITVTDLQPAIEKVERHQTDLLLAPGTTGPIRYWVNSTSPKGYFLEKVLLGSGTGATQAFSKEEVHGKEIRYVDWLIAGILSMNMMFNALFGVGYVIVRYRKIGVLKRLKATPLKPFEFLSAQALSRLFLIQFVSTVLFVGCKWMVHFEMRGSYLDLFILMSLGAACMISLSLIIAARLSSEEFANGILNLISWPMMFLSGVWFSLEGAHPLVQKIALIFPLTHLISGARAIMIDGTPLAKLPMEVGMLGGMTLVFLTIGSSIFKWE